MEISEGGSAASSNLLILHPHETSVVVGLSRGTISFDILCLNEIWNFSLISV